MVHFIKAQSHWIVLLIVRSWRFSTSGLTLAADRAATS